jgi:hypothetical protein
MGQRHDTAAIYPRERHSSLCIGGWVEPEVRTGQVREIFTPLGFDPRNVQPVASRYID